TTGSPGGAASPSGIPHPGRTSRSCPGSSPGETGAGGSGTQPSLPLARRTAPLEDKTDSGAERSRSHYFAHGRELQCFVGSAGFTRASRGTPHPRLNRDSGQELPRLLLSRQHPTTRQFAAKKRKRQKILPPFETPLRKTVLSSPP